MAKIADSALQVGVSSTATNNFTLVSDGAGAVKLARGNMGATTQDVLTVDANGRITWTQGINGTVSASTTNTVTNKLSIVINGTTYYLLASTSGA